MIKIHKRVWVSTLISGFETSLTSGVKETGYNSDRMVLFVVGIATYL
jgi:hypothetical protein